MLKDWEYYAQLNQSTADWQLTQAEYLQIIEGEVLYSNFLPWRVYNTLFSSKDAIDDEHRGRLWIKLLNAEKNKKAASHDMY